MIYCFQKEGVQMEYSKLLDLATDLGYELAMCGAETYRIEESITLVLKAYDIDAEAFVIPNCMHISIEPVIGRPLTRMRRIGHHGNDLNGVEIFSGLSRSLCQQTPPPEIAQKWLDEARAKRKIYSMPVYLLGNALGAAGFAMFFGGSWVDALCAVFCGILVGYVTHVMGKLHSNPFFTTIAASAIMAILAYCFGNLGIAQNADSVIIGTLMILVPGLLFTNAMRDIIYGDINSGVNRIVQVLLIATAIVLGTASAWNVTDTIFGTPTTVAVLNHGMFLQGLSCVIGCIGFTVLFNIHGKGTILCVLGGLLTWLAYALSAKYFTGEIMAYFYGAVFASLYAEIMARIRKCPAVPFLVVCIFPLIPGAGVYYTMNYAVHGDMTAFSSKGMQTAAIAGLMAVGILLVSTIFRMYSSWKRQYHSKTH